MIVYGVDMERIDRPITGTRTRRVILGAVLFGVVPFRLCQDTRQVNAQTSLATPAATLAVTRTPTPDHLATRVAVAQQELERERQAANQRATATTIAKQIDILRHGTRTPIPTTRPANTATPPGPKINEVVVAIETVVKGRLNEKETATALVRRQTPTPTSTPRPSERDGRRGTEESRRTPLIVQLALGGGLVGAALYRQQEIRNFAIPIWTGIRARFGGAPPAPPAPPVAGAGP